MEFNILCPDIESLPFLKADEDIPILVPNNSFGKSIRVTNLKIPKCEGIYFLYNNNKDLIYIGETKSLMQRISSHRKLRKFVYVKFFETSYSKRKRIAIEQLLIDKFNPEEQEKATQHIIPFV